MPPVHRILGTLGAALVISVAGLSSVDSALAEDPPPSAKAARVTLRKVAPVVVAPMGATAAAVTAQARGGVVRTAPEPTAVDGIGLADAPELAAAGRFWELQLNLCNSGFAGCYRNGNAVIEGGDLIHSVRPDLVTVNEICRNDIAAYLQPSLAESWPQDWTYSVFHPAMNKVTGAPYKCRNGHDFGNAVLGRVPAAGYRGVNGWAGEYLAQDGVTEQRTFACAYAIGDHLSCATHLSAASEPVALSQCQALVSEAVPAIRAAEGATGRTVIGADLNLRYDPADPEHAQHCVPGGYVRKGDGSVQHVIFSNDVRFTSVSKYGMTYTDHPGFLVRLTMP